jgi:uncharacterized membrane protein
MPVWTAVAPAVAASFLASLVEVVEAFTIVLAAATVRGWRPAAAGAGTGLLVLSLIVLALGPVLGRVPVQPLQVAVGVLLLLFGMRWLRKAILRAAGTVALHDEEAAFAQEVEELALSARRSSERLAWLAGLTAFKAVILEGIEVVFIVIAVGSTQGALVPAGIGAAAACLLVLLLGAAIHRPLARIPENTLKLGVGIMLSAFGVYWCGEGLAIAWPGQDLALPGFVVLFLVVALATIGMVRRLAQAGRA